ncbi:MULTISPECIES: hypothetical protein [Streptomyces]|uniref:Uncharacterized protein n=1 Tax=Streptomyces cacaoi TaxID=1898 RepID=A0A4Y3R7A3_STRCI|nr:MULTISPECIES: hypothetical protein [Streptomyces]NNG85675.1 hypothetical protein [Streptomyces cacaoi]QHF96453.1 hypothetical protein DEH18_24335 [Streptomyces sp. NHF165]GEB53615.1 hypothetical protein SCA03_61660 [Streptomyces cacaoi]
MRWGRARRAEARWYECDFPEPRQLRSAVPGIPFDACFRASWQPGPEHHRNPEAAVADDLLRRAAEITSTCRPLNVAAAQDAVNAALGRPGTDRGACCSRLTATFQLSLSDRARAAAEQSEEDRQHVSRLRFLRRQLHSDPELLLLDHLDRHPDAVKEVDLRDFQRVARAVRSGSTTWYPLLDCLEQLSERIGDDDFYAMKVLLKTFRETVPQLVQEHGLGDAGTPEEAEQ